MDWNLKEMFSHNRGVFRHWFLLVVGVVFSLSFVLANVYYSDVFFTVPNSVYITNERIEFKGYVYQSNYTDNGTIVSIPRVVANARVNLTVTDSNGAYVSGYNFTTDSNGAFYSRSNFYTSAPEATAPSTAGRYHLRASYIDVNNYSSFSESEIEVVNSSVDLLTVRSTKATYNPGDSVTVEAAAVKLIGDRILLVSNISIAGSLRNSTKDILQTFSCTTGNEGKCTATLTAPSSYGEYIIEVDDFKTFNSFFIIPFSYVLSMKDDIGKSLKNTFAFGEQARVEVKINGASSSEIYTFSGYIADSSGNSVKTISETTLNNNNSFSNSFLFTIDGLTFNYGAYAAHVTVTKSGDGSVSSLTSFQVQDWMLSVDKKGTGSGFEYEYSAFPNATLKFEALPTYRVNGSVIENANSSSFSVELKDTLNNVVASSNVSWNATCGKSGCYEFLVRAPSELGKYLLDTTFVYNGDTQKESKVVYVISGVLGGQFTDKDGAIKELFGTNEYAYASLSAYNQTASEFNLTDAEVFLVKYMNGSEFSYAQVGNWDLVNATNDAYEWAWNSSLQRIKMDVPKIGGLYNVFIFGNNRTLGSESKFIVNPYDVCTSSKNTPGTVSGSGYYYVWQFKTTETVYFEIKASQANNPLGRASASNFTAGNGTGLGAACNINTQTTQAVSNATITVVEVKNLDSTALESVNTTESVCQASDSSGGYTCTVKPLTKWDGGIHLVKFNVVGKDGTSSVFYGRFEARAFYLYGWSSVWQNSPSNNITLNLQMYEPGSGWWSGRSGLSGSAVVKRIEYQGREGEWLWPPVDSGYNVSGLSSVSISTGSGSLVLPASLAKGGNWKTGYYRIVLQGTTSGGDTDYGWAWFGVKLWDVYGNPVECAGGGCSYKSYFNSKENITLYIKISKAGDYSYGYQGGQDIYGNVSIAIKKIEDCRKWPCKELNATDYISSALVVNESSPWYWNANGINQSNYLIEINSTRGSWGTGWYSVTLNINGTDTGSAWFNTIAFYVESRPTDANATNWVYSIRPSQPMYFNLSVTKSYKWGSYSGFGYNESDYVNATIESAVLRTWDQSTYKTKEYNYPGNINISLVNNTGLLCVGGCLANVSYLNGSWPVGYYWGEMTLRNSDNETSTSWLWFESRMFRTQVSVSNYNVDSEQCVNASLDLYEPSWYNSAPAYGNYSVTSIYEDVWSGGGSSRTQYTNYTNSSFNASTMITICPNSGGWNSGSWGGYHYLNIVVRDNVNNVSDTGWLSFRTVPFQVSWGGVSGGTNKRTTDNIEVVATLSKPTGGSASGNLTSVYQWRCDYSCSKETYRFRVGSCDSSTSTSCTINGAQTVTIYAPSNGWRVGGNSLQATWTRNDSNVAVEDWGSIYFNGMEAYNGYLDNYDNSGNWGYNFARNENITIRLNVQDANSNYVDVNISSVQYAFSGNSCWSDYCRSYTNAEFSPRVTSSGRAVLNIQYPSTNWSLGYYSIRANVSGSAGSAMLTGGSVRVKDMTPPTLTLVSPASNTTYSTNVSFRMTTSENSQCYTDTYSYNSFYWSYCGNNWNVSYEAACNNTKYNYSGNAYYNEYVGGSWHYIYNGYSSSYPTTYMSTGGTLHTYTFNVTNWTSQSYGLRTTCYDNEDNYASTLTAFHVNNG